MGRVGVSIRGAEPRHTLILVDGQPVMGDISKYSGQGDELQRLGTENVERIEIIKGAASAKYGADAIGGVINVITKKASKTPSLQLNVEGRRAKGNGDILPYDNFFLRADSGQMGKFKIAAYGSKRDIMPVYEAGSVIDTQNNQHYVRNSLRFFGDIKNIGLVGTYDINDKNTIDVNFDRTDENLERYIKHSSNPVEPQQHFKRKVTRDKQSITWNGTNGGNTDWKISYDQSKLNEDDITLSSYDANNKYEGKNTLEAVDTLTHKQWNVNAAANTQLNDHHLLSYGFGYSQETAEGSRIKGIAGVKNRVHTYLQKIDPWNYDKNLKIVAEKDAEGNTIYSNKPSSNVHNYPFMLDESGIPYYNQNMEYYNTNTAPVFSAEDFNTYANSYGQMDMDELKEAGRWDDAVAFAKELLADPGNKDKYFSKFTEEDFQNNPSYYTMIVGCYYNKTGSDLIDAVYHGKKFKEIYEENQNHIEVGKATIKKQHFFIGDTWQLNDSTILSPMVRADHSDLFGSKVTFNIGLTHTIHGKANQRFKANIGTGYTEPGMGELYYNWQMYSGSPAGTVAGLGSEIGRLGYYWVGNPDLKPEKSVNFDMGLETEHGKTSTRFNVFHNKITDYMSVYFTGKLMDFHPGNSAFKFIQPPDMIYSFKNIGKAEITGIEAEINHKFDAHWSARLGYTYLQALNKSDPTMPDRLLDKPQHKVDIGVTYENKGWRASLWGNYYIHMLDSNSIAGNGNYMEGDNDHTHYFFEDLNDKKNMYQKKTFNIWNILVQKELSKDASMYVGIDNMFNHRDDDRALQERVYKMGVNLKFGPGSAAMEKQLDKTIGEAKVVSADAHINTDWFIQKPFDTAKEKGTEVIGDYRARWNTFTGENRPEARVTSTASIGNAEKNMKNSAGHGFEQRLRLGVDARVGDNTNVKILGSASGMSGVDTMHDVSDSKGMNHQRLDTVDVTRHADKWDFSVGRLTEPMGVTGYWFGKEYDGGRAVWTSGKNQVRVGYGDFSHSTGITDSAYTHAIVKTIYRAPNVDEWLGYIDHLKSSTGQAEFVHRDGYTSMYEKLKAATSFTEQQQIFKEYLNVIKEHYPTAYADLAEQLANVAVVGNVQTNAWGTITLTDAKTGENLGTYIMMRPEDSIDNGTVSLDTLLSDGAQDSMMNTALDEFNKYGNYENGRAFSYSNDKKFDKKTNARNLTITKPDGTTAKVVGTWTFKGYYQYTGDGTDLVSVAYKESRTHISSLYMLKGDESVFSDMNTFTVLNADQAKALAARSTWDISSKKFIQSGDVIDVAAGNSGKYTNATMAYCFQQLFSRLADYISVGNLPSNAFGDDVIKVENAVELQQDTIPAIDRALFVQAKHQFGNDFGVQAWYFHSTNDDTHTYAAAHGDHNDTASFDSLANVLGIGAKWRLGSQVTFSYDWGQNRTDFGRYMNGHTIYENHTEDNSSFDFGGRANGGTPRFWVARLDVGHADTQKPGSWNAFVDYKYFQHGSFFGGNGTEGLPDRYLDGIKSFTIGGGYVPAKDILLEAFYTFGAKGIGQRDTLYGPESFTLGDYTRIQATFKF